MSWGKITLWSSNGLQRCLWSQSQTNHWQWVLSSSELRSHSPTSPPVGMVCSSLRSSVLCLFLRLFLFLPGVLEQACTCLADGTSGPTDWLFPIAGSPHLPSLPLSTASSVVIGEVIRWVGTISFVKENKHSCTLTEVHAKKERNKRFGMVGYEWDKGSLCWRAALLYYIWF